MMESQALQPLPRYRATTLPPLVTRSKQSVRLALGERLAHNPLQPFAPARTAWHAYALRAKETLLPPQISPEGLEQAEAQADQLFGLIEFVRHCTKSTDRALFFRPTSSGGFSLKTLGLSLPNVLPVLFALNRMDCSDLTFAPSIETAYLAYVHVGLHQVLIDWSQRWESKNAAVKTLLEDFGDRIREHQRSASAGREQERHDAYHRRRTQEIARYFAKLAKANPTGYLMRAELETASGGTADHKTRYLHMHRTSADFIRRLKLMYGDAMKGNARLIDLAGGNGYQAHVALVFDGPSQQEMREIEAALPSIWKGVDSNGLLRDTNAIEKVQYRGTGVEYRDYECLSSQLKKAAIYMAETRAFFGVSVAGAPDGLVLAEAEAVLK